MTVSWREILLIIGLPMQEVLAITGLDLEFPRLRINVSAARKNPNLSDANFNLSRRQRLTHKRLELLLFNSRLRVYSSSNALWDGFTGSLRTQSMICSES